MPRMQSSTVKRTEGLLLFALVVAAHGAVLFALAPSPATRNRPRPPVAIEVLVQPSAPSGPQVEHAEVRSAAPTPRPAPARTAALHARPSDPVTPSRLGAAETVERSTGRTVRVPAPDAGADSPAEASVHSAPSGLAPSAAAQAPSARAVAAPPAEAPITPPRFDAPHLRNPDAEYPRLARRLGEQGRVLLRVLVSSAGIAERVEVQTSSGSPRLDHAAREAVARWQFVPARRGEEPVAAWLLVPIVFRLEG